MVWLVCGWDILHLEFTLGGTELGEVEREFAVELSVFVSDDV